VSWRVSPFSLRPRAPHATTQNIDPQAVLLPATAIASLARGNTSLSSVASRTVVYNTLPTN
jgi:hypothetical protein